jgi:hypothetical protein
MLVVLASRHDQAGGRLFDTWGGQASVLTCQDLSARGWRYCPGGEVGASVIGGKLTRADQIDGVLTRLPYVSESELGSIVACDRSYVAAEMTAFLSAWLSDLRCPVLNRPTAECLMGPHWRREKWVLTAARLGIPIVTACRSVPDGMNDGWSDLLCRSTALNVIGQSCVGNADESLCESAVALAKAAGVGLLRARFTAAEAGAAFIDADYWVDIADPAVSDAILDYFAGQCFR